jgi:4-amino-4-deoxy-L-arabinose transferase-like glycosyltransferase
MRTQDGFLRRRAVLLLGIAAGLLGIRLLERRRDDEGADAVSTSAPRMTLYGRSGEARRNGTGEPVGSPAVAALPPRPGRGGLGPQGRLDAREPAGADFAGSARATQLEVARPQVAEEPRVREAAPVPAPAPADRLPPPVRPAVPPRRVTYYGERDDAPRQASLARSPGALLAVVLAVVVATATLRLYHLRTAYELFLDEAIYARIGQNVATHLDVSFSQVHFYLHPPLYFLLEGGFGRWFSLSSSLDPIAVIDGMRILNVLFAAGSAALVVAIVARISGLRWALVAGIAYALDPFIVRFDSRVLLETSAVFWILMAIALLVTATSVEALGRWRLIAIGMACGLSLLTKETAAPLFMVLLVLGIVRANPLPRRSASLILATALLTYAPYPLTAFAIGDGGEFVDQKLSGVLRMVGLRQETGFNAPGAPSFVSRVMANLSTFSPSYVLIFAGFCAIPFLLRSTVVRERIIGFVTLGGFALLSYQIAIGTLEEQMFYYLVVPSLLAVASTQRLMSTRLDRRRRRMFGVATALVLAGSSLVWWQIHTEPDDGVRQTVRWVEQTAQPGDVVAPLVDTSQLLVTGHRLVVDGRFSVLRRERVRWVLTSSLQVEQGYGVARPDLIRILRRQATVAFQVRDRSSGTITVWRIRSSANS